MIDRKLEEYPLAAFTGWRPLRDKFARSLEWHLANDRERSQRSAEERRRSDAVNGSPQLSEFARERALFHANRAARVGRGEYTNGATGTGKAQNSERGRRGTVVQEEAS